MRQTLWNQILERLDISRQALYRQHCVLIRLIAQDDEFVIECGICNQGLLKLINQYLTELETAASEVLEITSYVQFKVIDTEKFHQISNEPQVENKALVPSIGLRLRIQKEQGLELTDGQAIALQSILDFLQNPTERSFLLTGYAGTGKTFLTQLILNHCAQHDLKFILAAPTNKAAKVLSQVTKEEAITIAKLLGIRPQINKETGIEVYVQDPEANPPNLENYDLLILDEASMISSELLKLLITQSTLFTAKFLFLGDPAQLPPVNETQSPVFSQISAQAQLTKVMRYDGAILNYATALRTENRISPLQQYVDQKTLQTLDEEEFTERVLSTFQCKEFHNDSDFCRVLAWTNQRVAQWNQRIRSRIFGEESPRFLSGERLIATGACTRRSDEVPGAKGNRFQNVVILPASGEIDVMEAHLKKGFVEYGPLQGDRFQYWEIHAVDEEGSQKTFQVLAESEKQRYQAMLHDFGKRKNWDCYWGLRRAFHPLQYAYALTVHRSQGSTFQRVFLDLPNLLANSKFQERKQLLYTAATRASDRLIVLHSR